ncbi:MAG: hypothetical protein EXS13_08780 [Planctomycetes bacterium]|nr:hypothetical protein [Planctomycetota bacterium]
MRARGHTLVKSALSVTIFAAVAGVACLIARETSGALAQQFDASVVRRHVSGTSALLLNEFGDANATNLTIDGQSALGDTVTFELPLDQVNGAVTWRARSSSGTAARDLPGGRASYLVVVADAARTDVCRLVRRAVDAAGATVGDDLILVDSIDVPDATQGKGFTMTRQGNLLTIRARTTHAVAGGTPAPTHDLVIRLRNGG